MTESVQQYPLALVRERCHDSEVSHVPRGEQQRAFTACEFGEIFFQSRVLNSVTGDQMRCATSRARGLCARGHCSRDCGVAAKRQIIVARKVDEGATAADDAAALLREGLYRRSSALEFVPLEANKLSFKRSRVAFHGCVQRRCRAPPGHE